MTVAFFVASLAASAQVQSAVNLHPANPFPFQTDALKQAWINANPKDYVRMGGDKPILPTPVNSATPEFTTQADKDAWLVQQEANAVLAKQAAINAPAASTTPVFATEADKEAWLAAQNPPAFGGANKEAMINAFNAGKPVFVDTGNPAADELNFNNAKQFYIQQNQAVYNYIISN